MPMPIEPFPLPAAAANLQHLDGRLKAGNTLLQPIVNRLAEAIGGQLTHQEALNNYVTKSLKQSIGGRVSASSRALNRPVNAVQTAVAAKVGEVAADMNRLMCRPIFATLSRGANQQFRPDGTPAQPGDIIGYDCPPANAPGQPPPAGQPVNVPFANPPVHPAGPQPVAPIFGPRPIVQEQPALPLNAPAPAPAPFPNAPPPAGVPDTSGILTWNWWGSCKTGQWIVVDWNQGQPTSGIPGDVYHVADQQFTGTIAAAQYWGAANAQSFFSYLARTFPADCQPITVNPTGGVIAPPDPNAPPVPAAPPPPPGPPPDLCQLPAVFVNGIPTPGTREWCQDLPRIMGDFVSLGQWVIDNSGVTESLNILSGDRPDFSGWDALNPGQALAKALSWLLSLSQTIRDQIKAFVACWKAVLAKTSACDPRAMLALVVIDSAIKLLRKIRAGTDAAVWLTIDIEVIAEPVEQTIAYLIQSLCPVEIPSPAETIEAFVLDNITREQAECWLLMRGCRWSVWEPVIRSRQEILTPEEIIQISRRRGYDIPTQNVMLRKAGFLDQGIVDAKQELYDELPTIQDHLHWLQRNVFDQEYVTDYRLMEGFNEKFWPAFGPDLRSQGMLERYAALHYAAHWIQPSPGQLAEMLQRLRPGRVGDGVKFTENDYLRLLAEQDVAPYFRERFRAVAYNQPALRFLRQLYDTFQVDNRELYERFQDLGYSPADAQLLTNSEFVNRSKRRATTGKGYTASVVSQFVGQGLMTQQDAWDKLSPQGYTQAEIADLVEVARLKIEVADQLSHHKAARSAALKSAISGYESGYVDKPTAASIMLNLGWRADDVDVMLAATDYRSGIAGLKSAIAALKKSFLRGELNATEAFNAGVRLGMAAPHMQTQLSLWQMSMTTPRQSISAAQILKWVKRGILSAGVAEARLRNLGFSNADSMLLLAEAAQDINTAAQKAAAAAAKQAKGQAAELVKIQKEQERLSNSLKSKIKAATPVGKLIKWYAMHVVEESFFRDRMAAAGYEQVAIDDAFKEAIVKREALDAKTAKKGATGIEYTGPGHS